MSRSMGFRQDTGQHEWALSSPSSRLNVPEPDERDHSARHPTTGEKLCVTEDVGG